MLAIRFLFFLFMGYLMFNPPALAWVQSSAFFNTTEEAKTYRLIDAQTRNQEIGFSNSSQLQYDLDRGRDRARAVVKTLSDSEIKSVGQEFKEYGENLRHNPYVQGPAKILGVGTALWVGQNYTIASDDQLRLVSRFEGRSRLTSLDLASPVVNGQLRFIPGDGINLGVSRMLPLIDSRAEVKYHLNHQTISTQLSRQLIAHLVLSVGASDAPGMNAPEGNAKIAYQILL